MRRAVYLLTLGFIGILAATTSFVSVRDRANVEEAAFRDAENVAGSLANYTRELVAGIDHALVGVANALHDRNLADPTEREPVFALLKARQGLQTDAIAFFVADASGTLRHSSRAETVEPVDVSAREFMIAAHARPAEGLVISAPYQGTVGHARGRQVVSLSRAIRSADGTLVGVVGAAVPTEKLGKVYGTVDVGPRGRVGLFRSDGTLLAASSPRGGDVSFPSAIAGKREVKDRGRFATTVGADSAPLLVAYRAVGEYPLLTNAGIDPEQALADWRIRALLLGGIALAGAGVAAAAAWVLLRVAARRQRDQEEQSRRLALIASASAELAQAASVDALLDLVAQTSRRLIGAHQCVVTLSIGPDLNQVIHAVSLGDKYATWRSYDEMPDGSGIYMEVCRTNQPMRMTQAELEAHPLWRGFGAAASRHPPMRGWLAVPLVARDGANLGIIQLSDRHAGDFTVDDQSICLQLAHITAVAVENLRTADWLRLSLAAEQEVRGEADRARTRMETILESISDAFYVLDRDFRFRYLNDRARQVLGADMIGRTVWEAFPLIEDTRLGEGIRRAMESDQSQAFEYHAPRSGAWFSFRIYPFEDGLSVYFRDVTEQREAEERLQQAMKMEAVGRLTGGIAHDFNNLLTVMLGLGDAMMEQGITDPSMRQNIETIVRAAERAAQLTNSLLAFSRRQPLEPKPTDVAELLRRMERLLRRAIGETVAMEVVTLGGLWRAMVDPGQLELAILNLAINARDAMPQGGRLTVEASNVRLDADYVAHNAEAIAGHFVLVAVSDEGEGMAADVLARATEPYFTTKGVGKGSGLGLSMVYGFARQTGGHMKIYSEVGVGTTVKLYLPRAPATEAVAGDVAAPELHPGSERILVVEDSEDVRAFTEMVLTNLGYDVTIADSGPQAMAILDAGQSFDLLLTDVVLPGGMNGREVAEAVAARQPGIRVLYTSGYTEDAMLHHGRVEPGVHLLQKPFRRADLARMVRQVLAG
ncbi:MAG: PAS domain-containing protein [Alphaproteobacteria bacterium]